MTHFFQKTKSEKENFRVTNISKNFLNRRSVLIAPLRLI